MLAVLGLFFFALVTLALLGGMISNASRTRHLTDFSRDDTEPREDPFKEVRKAQAEAEARRPTPWDIEYERMKRDGE